MSEIFFQKLGDLKSSLKTNDIHDSLERSYRVATQVFLKMKRFAEHIAQIGLKYNHDLLFHNR